MQREVRTVTDARRSATVRDMALVLVVEDELDIAKVLESYLQRSGYRTERAKDGVFEQIAVYARGYVGVVVDGEDAGHKGELITRERARAACSERQGA